MRKGKAVWRLRSSVFLNSNKYNPGLQIRIVNTNNKLHSILSSCYRKLNILFPKNTLWWLRIEFKLTIGTRNIKGFQKHSKGGNNSNFRCMYIDIHFQNTYFLGCISEHKLQICFLWISDNLLHSHIDLIKMITSNNKSLFFLTYYHLPSI